MLAGDAREREAFTRIPPFSLASSLIFFHSVMAACTYIFILFSFFTHYTALYSFLYFFETRDFASTVCIYVCVCLAFTL